MIQNRIRGIILPYLSPDELYEIGFTNLGDRKLFLIAIAFVLHEDLACNDPRQEVRKVKKKVKRMVQPNTPQRPLLPHLQPIYFKALLCPLIS
mmetsp:Transcript_12209/g.25011  ORF Transcript_12209/g.25011 Transcript_12209/m.25011 type:complete len:93 (-) Transcript_12209:664-942(-)